MLENEKKLKVVEKKRFIFDSKKSENLFGCSIFYH